MEYIDFFINNATIDTKIDYKWRETISGYIGRDFELFLINKLLDLLVQLVRRCFEQSRFV